jgi:LacI family transcriptional regulator
MKGREVTIKDLARELGISPSTVSRALSGHPDISDNTIKRVTELAEKYNYQPNAIALSLRSSKTRTIGVIIPEIAHFFFATVITGIEDLAARKGYNVILCHSNEQYEKEVKDARALLSHRVDGLLVSLAKTTTDFSHFDAFTKQKRPLVFFDRVPPDVWTSSVTVEDEQGAFIATEHLIEQGCKRIVHLAGPDKLNISIDRQKGYLRALKTNGIEVDAGLIIDCNLGAHLEEADQIVTGLFDKGLKFDGVFANNDLSAVGALKAIKRKGFKIPQEVAVIGYSNWPLAALVEPALSSINQPGYEMGRIAAQMFFDQIANPDQPPRHEVLKTHLVARESSLRKPK